MQQEEEEVKEKPDYDDLAMTPLIEPSVAAAVENDSKNKRHYWTAKEEEAFYEIWGRDNWRLTRHGKNTIYFAKWAEEMKDRHEIEITTGEVQAKVNQMRAKFRAVKKQLTSDKSSPRWKKFDVVERILKNTYRPKDAEPIPEEVLLKNRDVSANTDDGTDDATKSTQRPLTPTNSQTSSSQDTIPQQQQHTQSVIMSTEQHLDLNNSSLGEHDVSADVLFNANELQPNPDYASQLYADVKQEFTAEYNHQASYATQYTNEQNHFAGNMVEESPQLLELQTPQQLMQHHQLTQAQAQPPPLQTSETQQYNNVAGATVAYDHHSAPANTSYASSTTDVNMFNNQSHYSAVPQQQQQQQVVYTNNVPQQYSNNSYVTTNNNGNSTNNATNNGVMQPPRPAVQAAASRKRGRTTTSNTNHAVVAFTGTAASDQTLETQYLEEVRRKNTILDEQKDISRKRLHLEERKVALMEQFFPKFLEMQVKIVDRLEGFKQEPQSQ